MAKRRIKSREASSEICGRAAASIAETAGKDDPEVKQLERIAAGVPRSGERENHRSRFGRKETCHHAHGYCGSCRLPSAHRRRAALV